MDFARSNDRSLLSFYDSPRRQAEADKSLTGRHRFTGNTARHFTERLREEMERRPLRLDRLAALTKCKTTGAGD